RRDRKYFLDGQTSRPRLLTRAALIAARIERFGEREPRHVLHHQVMRLAGLLDAVDLRDVGMVQSGQELGFALEARQPLRVAREMQRQDFDGHVAVELGVAATINFPHPALADELLYFVVI